jgi:hypothetical protein
MPAKLKRDERIIKASMATGKGAINLDGMRAPARKKVCSFAEGFSVNPSIDRKVRSFFGCIDDYDQAKKAQARKLERANGERKVTRRSFDPFLEYRKQLRAMASGNGKAVDVYNEFMYLENPRLVNNYFEPMDNDEEEIEDDVDQSIETCAEEAMKDEDRDGNKKL